MNPSEEVEEPALVPVELEDELIADKLSIRLKGAAKAAPAATKSWLKRRGSRIKSAGGKIIGGLRSFFLDQRGWRKRNSVRIRSSIHSLRREMDSLTWMQLLAIIVVFGLFLVLPLISVVGSSFVDAETGLLTMEHFNRLFRDSNIWPWVQVYMPDGTTRWMAFLNLEAYHFDVEENVLVLYGWDFGAIFNSIYIAILVTIFSVLLGVFLAFIIARYDFRGKSIIRTLLIFPILATPFVGAIGIKVFLNADGFVNKLLYDTLHIIPFPIWLRGIAAIIFVQSFSFFSLVYLNAYSSFMGIDPSLEEQAENLGATGSQLFRKITLPLAMPGIQAGAILTFILSIEDLGTPIVFQDHSSARKTLAYQVFVNVATQAGGVDPKGPAIGVMLLVFALVGFLAIRKYASLRSYESGTKGGQWNPRTRQLQSRHFSISGIILSIVFAGWLVGLMQSGFNIANSVLLAGLILTAIARMKWPPDKNERGTKGEAFQILSLLITGLGIEMLFFGANAYINPSFVSVTISVITAVMFIFYILTMDIEQAYRPVFRVPTTIFLYVFLIPLLFFALIPQISVIMLSFAGPWSTADLFPEMWTLSNYDILWAYPDVTRSINLTLIYGAIATVVIVLLGASAAYIIARRDIPGKQALDLLVTSPIALPGIVIATGYFTMFYNTPIFPPGGPAFLIVMSYTVRKFPFTVRAAFAGLMSTPVVLEEASQNMGASRNKTFAKITMPLIGVSVLAGSLLSFVYSVSEVSTSLILGSVGREQAPMTFWTKEILESTGIWGGAKSAACLGVLMMALQMVVITITNKILGTRSSAITGI